MGNREHSGCAEEGREGESKSVGRRRRRLRFADSIRADVGAVVAGKKKKEKAQRKDGDGDKILWKRRMWLERRKDEMGVTTLHCISVNGYTPLWKTTCLLGILILI